VKPWGFWATLGFAVLAFGLGQAVATAGLAAWVGDEAFGSSLRYDGTSVAIGTLLANAVQVITLVLAARLAGSSHAAEYLALDRPRRADLIFGFACLLVLIVVGDAATWLAGRDLVPPFQLEIYRSSLQRGTVVLLWVALTLAAPAGEEILFRGFMFRGWLQPPNDPRAVVLLIALVWSLLHVQYDWFGMLQVFVTGILFGWVRWRSGSTTLLILLHIGLNLEGMAETMVVISLAS